MVEIAPVEEATIKDCYNILSLGLLPVTMFEFNKVGACAVIESQIGLGGRDLKAQLPAWM